MKDGIKIPDSYRTREYEPTVTDLMAYHGALDAGAGYFPKEPQNRAQRRKKAKKSKR